MAPPGSFRHAYACLVHESPECVTDLVRNLRYLDPDSLILVYNGGKERHADVDDAARREGALVHPRPIPLRWGRLHPFALRCMAFLSREEPVDAMTIVDSDQSMLRSGYVSFLRERVHWSGLGLLSSSPGWKNREFRNGAVISAWRDVHRFRPWLAKFPGSEEKFPHYTFWPGTVLTQAGMELILDRFGRDMELVRLVNETTMAVTEEIVFPTLLALLGLRVDQNPCRQDWVQYRSSYSVSDANRALATPGAFFMHTVPRQLDDRVRARIREHHGGYT